MLHHSPFTLIGSLACGVAIGHLPLRAYMGGRANYAQAVSYVQAECGYSTDLPIAGQQGQFSYSSRPIWYTTSDTM